MTSERGFYGWKLVFILWFIDFLNMGFPLYGGAVINTYMLKEIPMSRSAFGLGFTILNIFVGIPSILVAASIVRWGVRKTFGIGSLLILIGALWLAVIASRPWHYWVGFGVLAATGISFGTIIPAATAITRWFSRYRGRTLAVTLSASGFAGFFVAPAINRILTRNGGNWRQAWAIVAAVSALSAIVAFLFVRERPEDLGQMVDGGPAAAPSADSTAASARVTKFPWEPHQAYRTRAYWMILIGAIACQFPFFFFTAHWLLHLKGTGIRHGSLYPRSRFRPVDWRLANGRHGRALRVHAGFLLLFLGVLSGHSSFSGGAVDRLRRRDSLWHGIWMDVYLLQYGHRSLLRTCGFSKGERNGAAARSSLLLAGWLLGRETI